ncbi:MAG: dTDP-4-dehydrorhamnose reductase [Patescibacteria group bacterium]|nr:dTDP-4-dehydrorhamnose reductase [Patescibacteria group bacterium]MDD4610946.1 dTDP-4-dehydrorhamnose reductase [Patescibacteria group bacterium]
MKIIILGAKGNLGTQLVKVFNQSEKYEVIAWDKDDIDITDKELMEKKLKEIKPDIIINVVAYNAVDKCEKDDAEYEIAKKINCDTVGNLAQISLEINALFIHYSTDYIFGGIKKEGYNEDDEPGPISRYAQTKLSGEKEIIRRSGKGLKWYLIRTSKLFGPKGKSEAAKPSFFNLMIDLSKTRDSLDVVNEELSCFTYTPDLARATQKIIEERKGYGIYHIVNSGPITWYKAAVELFKILGNNKIKLNSVASDKFPRPAKRPKYSVLINNKLEPLRDWREALREYLRSKK